MERPPNATLLKGARLVLAGDAVWEATADLEVFATRDADALLVRVSPGLTGRVGARWVRPFWGVTIPAASVLRDDPEGEGGR